MLFFRRPPTRAKQLRGESREFQILRIARRETSSRHRTPTTQQSFRKRRTLSHLPLAFSRVRAIHRIARIPRPTTRTASIRKRNSPNSIRPRELGFPPPLTTPLATRNHSRARVIHRTSCPVSMHHRL